MGCAVDSVRRFVLGSVGVVSKDLTFLLCFEDLSEVSDIFRKLQRDHGLPMLNTRMRSAPRSGTTMKESVGSTRASCGCGASCLAGFVPGAVSVKGKFWRNSKPPDDKIFQDESAEPPLFKQKSENIFWTRKYGTY